MTDTITPSETPIDHENHLLQLFIDRTKAGGKDYFDYLGLERDASWGSWRRHYDKAGLPDLFRAAEDLYNYPPLVARVKELQAEKAGREKPEMFTPEGD